MKLFMFKEEIEQMLKHETHMIFVSTDRRTLQFYEREGRTITEVELNELEQ